MFERIQSLVDLFFIGQRLIVVVQQNVLVVRAPFAALIIFTEPLTDRLCRDLLCCDVDRRINL